MGRFTSGINTVTDYQRNALWSRVFGEPTYEGQTKALHKVLGHIPIIGQAEEALYNAQPGPLMAPPGSPVRWLQDRSDEAGKAIIDAALWTPLDPLTYESMGSGWAWKQAMKIPRFASWATKAGEALANSRAGQSVHDFFHWAPEARRAGYSTERLRGAAGVSSAQGANLERHFNERFANIVDGVPIKTADGRVRPGTHLTDEQLTRIGQVQNGEAKLSTLSPEEQVAYRKLQTLTHFDYELRKRGMISIAVSHIKDSKVRDGVQAAFASGKDPVIPKPEPRVRKPYGQPIPRERNIYSQTLPDYQAMWNSATANMDPVTRSTFGKALTSPSHLNLLPAELQQQARDIQAAIRQRFTPTPIKTIPLKPKQRYTFLPANQEAINLAQKVQAEYNRIARDIEENLPRRVNYAPAKHRPTSQEEGRRAVTVSQSKPFDPRALQRQDIKITNAHQMREGYQAMASNAGRQRSTVVLHQILGQALEDPAVAAAFEKEIPATGAARTNKEWFKDIWTATVGYPRAATVSVMPRHAFNVYDLAVNTVPPELLPQFTAEMSSLVGKLVTASPREAAELTRDGRELYGTLGSHFTERKPFFQKFPDQIPIPWTSKAIPLPKWLADKPVPVLARWTRFNNKLVWSTDMAAATIYARMIKQTGEAARVAAKSGLSSERDVNLVAGGLARDRLIDYENRSQFQEFMRYLSPFGTFRGGIPQAVIGGVGRNPPRAAFLGRATGGAFYGNRPGPQESGWQVSTPTADVGELLTPFEGTARFAASTLGNLPSATIGMGSNILGQLQPPFKRPDMARNPLAYGQTWLPARASNGQLDPGWLASQALSGVLEAQAALQAMGISRYKWKGMAHEFFRQLTGAQYKTPNASTTIQFLPPPATRATPSPVAPANPLDAAIPH